MPEVKNGYLTPPQTPPPHAAHRQAWGLPHPSSRIGKILGRSLELVDIIGTGAYGVVYEGYDHQTGAVYAVKALSKVNADGEPLDKRQRDFHAREIQLHYAASAHPNVLTMLKIVDDPDCTYVVLQYCTEGDLFASITEKGRYVGNDELVRKAYLQILDAVEHCHRLGIYHRDLKPENILVSNFGTEMLLADFGLATMETESEDHGCGSTFYMSPECLDQSPKGSKYQCASNDIWSLGVILVNLACGRNPWKQASVEDSTYRAFTRNRNFLKTILPLSEELNNILGRIFDPSPEARITVGELKECIARCPTFSGPIQPIALPSPPPSPQAYRSERCNSISSDEGSLASDEGSLTGSCSTLSDSDFSDDETPETSDEGYESMDQDQDIKPAQNVYAQRFVEPEPFQNQAPQYALPQPRSQNWPCKPNPWFQPWGQYTAPYHFQPVIHGCVSPSYSSHHYGSGYR